MNKALYVLLFCFPVILLSQNPLLIPDTLSGTQFQLNLDQGSKSFFPDQLTNTIGYNQDILGPTLIFEQGQNVSIDVVNGLSEPTTLHWHGLHVSSENDGGPHTVIQAGETWSPSFTILDHAATYWYHPHLHEHTEQQVTEGAAGFIIVRDEAEAQLNLPRRYGLDDFPLVIQSRAFDSNRQFQTGTAADQHLMVNATLDPFLEVPAQVVRFRLLNGSTERVYNLGFDDNQSFYQIASDGGLLNTSVPLTRLLLSPGERAEILVDMTGRSGQIGQMMSFGSEIPNGIYGASNPSAMGMGSISGYSSNPLNGNDFDVLKLEIKDAVEGAVFSIINELVTNIPYAQNETDVTRTLTFTPRQMGMSGMLNGPFVINGVSFDMNVINYQIPLNNTEVWELVNQTAIAHPFHIHDVQFYILDINGNPPPQHLSGRKDVVLVPPMGGRVRFITRFDDFANPDIPFMYHCHMLSHEDDGMMGQFVVVDQSTKAEKVLEKDLVIYPSPAIDKLHLIGVEKGSVYRVYNSSGILQVLNKVETDDPVLNISKLLSGVYFIELRSKNQIRTARFVRK